ncbi:hypothetical protein MTO96_037627, partial [Rhipicephalus appendiculatus]
FTQGVNVDWNYPGDPCDTTAATSDLFYNLTKEIKDHGIDIMISVSPVKSRLTAYSLKQVVSMVDYIIIKTHTFMAPPIPAQCRQM